jgi:hypothetical protein
MTRDELLSLVQSIYTGSTDDVTVLPLLDKLEYALPHGDICDLIFQDMRNLTPTQVVDEAIRREADYTKTLMKD